MKALYGTNRDLRSCLSCAIVGTGSSRQHDSLAITCDSPTYCHIAAAAHRENRRTRSSIRRVFAMGWWDQRSSDWQVRSLLEGAGGAGLAGGGWLFNFQNNANGQSATFAFTGFGLGAGVAVEASLPTWTRIDSKHLSFKDLNWAGGQIASAGAGLAVGAGAMVITAGIFNNLFYMQPVIGVAFGGYGAAGLVVTGVWKYLGS